MDYKRLSDDLTEMVAQQLNYFDYQNKGAALSTYQEVLDATEGGMKRYLTDPCFCAMVKSMVAGITSLVQAYETGEEWVYMPPAERAAYQERMNAQLSAMLSAILPPN